MKQLKNLFLFNTLFFYFLFVAISILSFKYPIFLIFLGLLTYFLIKNKIFNFMFLILGMFAVLNYSISYNSKPLSNFNHIKVKIVEKNNEKSYICKLLNKKVIVYFKNKDYKLGDIVLINSIESPISQSNLDYVFNYKEYLKNKKIEHILYAQKEEKIKNVFVLGKINESISLFIENKFSDKTSKYLNVLLIGNDRYFDQEVKDDINFLSASHLLCISGLHLNLLILMIGKLNHILKIKESYLEYGIVFFLFVFCFIVNFSPSVLRVTGCFMLVILFKKLKLLYTSLDILSIVALVLILLNPFYLFNLSFQLSFLVSFSLILSNDMIHNKSLLKSIFLITMISNLATLPLMINISNQINLLGLLSNVILVLFFSFIFLPITFLLVLMPFLEKIYLILIDIFENFAEIFSNNNHLLFRVSNINLIEGILLTSLIFLLFRSFYHKKDFIFSFSGLFLFMVGISLKGSFINNDEIIFFDCGQGDSSYYEYEGCKMLIDFYGNNYQYIYKKEKTDLDYLVLTHGHDDHFSDLETLFKKINVKNFLISYYDNSDIIKEIYKLQATYKYNIIRAKQNDKIICNRQEIEILSPVKTSDNLNNISLVFKVKFYQYEVLYTGDIEKEVEKELYLKYKEKLKSAILKVGHHGSNTSSSLEFLNYVLPKLSVISLKENNKFGFPGKYAVFNLNLVNTKILITSNDKNVILNKKTINNYF